MDILELHTLCWKKDGSRYLSNRSSNLTSDFFHFTWGKKKVDIRKAYNTCLTHKYKDLEVIHSRHFLKCKIWISETAKYSGLTALNTEINSMSISYPCLSTLPCKTVPVHLWDRRSRNKAGGKRHTWGLLQSLKQSDRARCEWGKPKGPRLGCKEAEGTKKKGIRSHGWEQSPNHKNFLLNTRREPRSLESSFLPLSEKR